VLYAVGYDRTQQAPIERVYVDGLAAVLAALPPATGKFIYVSSTGVYGQASGETVDELSPTEPTRAGGRACLAAEQLLAGHSLGSRAIVLRLAGIYGPGRIPLVSNVQSGKPIVGSADGTLNLIHVDDAAQVVLAAEQRATPPRTYVVSDGRPIVRREFYAELARLLGAAEPTFAPPEAAASSERMRGGADKRVSNARMLAELRPALAFGDFRAGLAAIVGEG
jgi:nucleoside-diphosphate-sugar epimerase